MSGDEENGDENSENLQKLKNMVEKIKNVEVIIQYEDEPEEFM